MQRLVLWMLIDVVPKYYIGCSWSLWWSLLFCEIVIALAWWGPKIKSWFLNGNQFLVCSIWMKYCPQLHAYDLSAAPGLGTESSSCVVSFFHSPIFLLKTQSRFTSLAVVRVSLQCSLAMDSSPLERVCLLTTFNTQICVTERFICNIKVLIFSFAISIHPIKLTNAKVITNQEMS